MIDRKFVCTANKYFLAQPRTLPQHFLIAITALLVFVAALLATPHTQAQMLYGTLTGTVTDSSGAAVVGVQVTALGTQTGVKQSSVTNADGIYRFAAILPGTYTVTISATGFATQTTPSVAVLVNGVAQLNVQLKVGKASQTVTVTTATPLLQTENAEVQANITTREIENLPIFGTAGANPQELLTRNFFRRGGLLP